MQAVATDMDALYRAHKGAVWGLCYRMTGSAADADELTQDTFLRAMTRPPQDSQRPWRPWLWRVALNLSRDHLRQRQRRAYPGPWLPQPVPDAAKDPWPQVEPSAEARYALAESASLAFLASLEALTPQQRAVLLLRDVLDYSTQEAAQALELSQGAVKTCLHRARATMQSYDQHRAGATPKEVQLQALQRLMGSLMMGDVAQVEALLTQQVQANTDSGGVYSAATRTLEGPRRVAAFLLGLSRMFPDPVIEMSWCNGAPGLKMTVHSASPRVAPLAWMQASVDAQGQVCAIHLINAPHKLRLLAPA